MAGDACLLKGRQFSPTGAFSVDHGFPPRQSKPEVQRLFGNTLFFEVVKDIFKALRRKPRS